MKKKLLLNSLCKEKRLTKLFLIKRLTLVILLIGMFHVNASPNALLQQQTVKGKVTDATTGEAIIGGTVTIEGTTKGVLTDALGAYSIDIPSQSSVLVFTYLGYLSEKITVNGLATIDMKLSPDIKKLEEVVVIGYGSVKKSDLTGSVGQIKSSDLLTSATAASVENLLQGKTSGLQVISSSGEPGSSATLVLRGMNSINSSDNQPLVVVDGIVIGDAGNLKLVNPNDIESVDVLKDASATAIYGSMGANGVIMITTKKGRNNQSTIDVNVSKTYSLLPKPFDIVSDPYLYAELQNEANRNGGDLVQYTGQKLGETYYPSLIEIKNGTWKYKTYWPDVIYRTGQTQNYNVSARGGTDQSQYAVSIGYMNQDGIAIGNHFEKYNANARFNHKVRDYLTVGIDSKFEVDYSTHSGAVGAEGRSPVFPVDTAGTWFSIGSKTTDFGNPAENVAKILNKGNGFNEVSTGYFDWKITKDLTLHSDLSYNVAASTTDYYEPSDFGYSGYQYQGYANQNHYLTTQLVTNTFLTYNKTFAEKHTVSGMIGTNYNHAIHTHQSLTGRGTSSDDLTDQDFANASKQFINTGLNPDDIYGVRSLLSYFGRATYNYADRYLVTATLRADGASVFGIDNKWGYFPSAALRWNANKESFFPKTTAISALDFRLGWGSTGSQSQLTTYGGQDRLGGAQYYNGSLWIGGIGPGQGEGTDAQSNILYGGLANGSLKWQTTTQTNIGTDFDLLNSSIHVTADYYDKETKDLLFLTNIAPSSGFNNQNQNVASTSNKGFEVSVDFHIIKTRDLTWDFGANVSHNQNTVKSLNGQVPYLKFGVQGTEYRTQANVLMPGQPIGAFFGWKTAGIIQNAAQGEALGLTGALAQPGEIAYLHYGSGSDTMKSIIGSPIPKITFGLYTKIAFKGFDLAISGNGYQGNKVINFNKNGQGTVQYKRWTPDNPSNSYPSLRNGRTWSFSDYYLEDGSFLKIQNITLGYTLPLKTSAVKSIRFYLSCDNVYTFTKFTGYDPEPQQGSVGNGDGTSTYVNGTEGTITNGYPRSRNFTGGINFTF